MMLTVGGSAFAISSEWALGVLLEKCHAFGFLLFPTQLVYVSSCYLLVLDY